MDSDIVEHLNTLRSLNTQKEIYLFLNASPEIYSDDNLNKFLHLADMSSSDQIGQCFQLLYAFLAKCKLDGVHKAICAFLHQNSQGEFFTQLLRGVSEPPPRLSELVISAQEAELLYIRSPKSAEFLNQSVNLWHEIIVSASFEESSEIFRSIVLNSLGSVLLRLYRHEGSENHLDEMILNSRRALSLAPKNTQIRLMILNNIGIALLDKLNSDSSPSIVLIEESLECLRESIAGTSIASSDLPTRYLNLGSILYERFQYTGELNDLDDAIDAWEKGLSLKTDEGTLASLLKNLGAGYCHRFRVGTADENELRKAIEFLIQAIEKMPKNHWQLPGAYSNLGHCYNELSRINNDFEYLLKAIRSHEESVDLSPSNSPDSSTFQHNLNATLLTCLSIRPNLEKINKIIDASESLINKEDFSTAKGARLTTLAKAYKARSKMSQGKSDIAKTEMIFRKAVEYGFDFCPEDALAAASNWGDWAFSRKDWKQAVEANNWAWTITEQLDRAQYSNAHRESWIEKVQGLTSQSAFALVQLKKYEAAVEIIERGTVRLMAEKFDTIRGNLNELANRGYAKLIERYEASAACWRSITKKGASSNSTVSREEMLKIRDELDGCIEKIREIGGYENFLKPVQYENVRQLALRRPLVYVFTTQCGSVALVISKHTKGKVKAIKFPMLTSGMVEQQFHSYWWALSEQQEEETLNDEIARKHFKIYQA